MQRTRSKTHKSVKKNLFLNCTIYWWLSLIFLLFIPLKINAQPPVTYVDSITEDEEGQRLSFPSFVFAEPVMDEIYVISLGRIIIYTSDFFPLFTLDKSRGIVNPQGLAVDARGNLYVSQGNSMDNFRISVFNACLKWVRDIYIKDIKFEGVDSFLPNHLAVDEQGNLYVAGLIFPSVLVLNNQGQLLKIISPEENDKKVNVQSVTIDENGKIYLVSLQQGRVYVYDKTGKLLLLYGQKGGSSAKLSQPQAVGVDNRNGRQYVVDYMRHTVSAYDKDGTYLFEFGGLGWGEGWFQYPRHITVDSAGRILVADTLNDRIQIFKPSE